MFFPRNLKTKNKQITPVSLVSWLKLFVGNVAEHIEHHCVVHNMNHTMMLTIMINQQEEVGHAGEGVIGMYAHNDTYNRKLIKIS